MNWDHAVSWGSGVWVSVSDIGRVGSGWPLEVKKKYVAPLFEREIWNYLKKVSYQYVQM